jgi:hypothetical protein
MAAWFEQNAVDLLGHALTVVGLVVGIVVVIWQLGRQHRSSLMLQRDNAREELKLEVHKLLVEKIRHASHANIAAAMYAYMIPFTLENYYKQLALGVPVSPIKERAPEFSRLNTEAGEAITDLIEVFESWAIAFPGIEIFQVAFNVASHDAREAFVPLFSAILRALPMDPPENAPANAPTPLVQAPLSHEQLSELKALVNRYKRAMDEIGCYLSDLTAEAQNVLLSGLFERTVPQRKPLDPSYKVISTKPTEAARLLQLFENETPWGREKAATEKVIKDAKAHKSP